MSETKPPTGKRHPSTKTRGPFEIDKAGWHACPFMGLRVWLSKDDMCGECAVENDSDGY